VTASQSSATPVATKPADRTDRATLAVFGAAQLAMVVANLGRIPVFSTGDREAPIMVNEFLLGLVVFTGILVAAQRGALRLDRVACIAFLFAALGASSAFWAAHSYGLTGFQLAVSLAYLARWVAYAMLYVALINTIDRGYAVRLWSYVERMLLIMAAFGIVQAAFLPNFAQRVFPDSRAAVDWDVQGHRLVSTILEPNIAACMIMIGVLVQLAQVSAGARIRRWKILVLFVALALTVSRSAILGLITGVVVLVGVRGISRRLLRLALAAGVLVLAALPKLIQFGMAYGRFSVGSGTSAGARVISWLQALRVFRDNPVFGIGFNTYGYVNEKYGGIRLGTSAYASDGGLLFVAVTTGLVGLAVYLWMLWTVSSNARRVWRDVDATPEARGLAVGVVASIAAVIVQSVFANSILTPFVMEILWVLWASVAILSRPARIERSASVPRLVPLRV
jgi:O-antigen ligase